VGFCDGQKMALGKVSPANLHSICFSTIIFPITRGWHNRPGVAAVPTASQSKIKKITSIRISDACINKASFEAKQKKDAR
jgi:hypothetical protein